MAPFGGLEHIRLQLLQNAIKLPMTPCEGAVQLTVRQANRADSNKGFQGTRFYCRIGTIKYVENVRLQISTENADISHQPCIELKEQLEQQLQTSVRDLTLEHISPDGGRSTQLVHTFLVSKSAAFLRDRPYHCDVIVKEQERIRVRLRHCGTRLGLQPPRKVIRWLPGPVTECHYS